MKMPKHTKFCSFIPFLSNHTIYFPLERKNMTKFTNYQRWMWTCLSYLTVCRYYIDKDPAGKYVIKKAGRWRTLAYKAIWFNSFAKIIYLFLTYHGLLLPVTFLDQMTIWIFVLGFCQVLQESNMWTRREPLFEILYANWVIQEDVFAKLGSPPDIEAKIIGTCKSLVRMHLPIIFIGCSALMFQFFLSPTFALMTFAITPTSWSRLKPLFAAHEYFFIFHIWIHQASSIVLLEVFSVTYTHLILAMGDALKQLEHHGKKTVNRKQQPEQEGMMQLQLQMKERRKMVAKGKIQRLVFPKRNRTLDPRTVAEGTSYTILKLVKDYRRVMFAAREFNNWAGKCMGGTTMTNYAQFIVDVFIMIQLLKEPEPDYLGVFFFFEDAMAGMGILLRQLLLMSALYPASERFLQHYKQYLTYETGIRRYLRKTQRTLQIVPAKIGGYSTNPSTVPKGFNALFNYYIGAAMWENP